MDNDVSCQDIVPRQELIDAGRIAIGAKRDGKIVNGAFTFRAMSVTPTPSL
jgi:hypothetical protein